MNITDELRKLADLKQEGHLTEQEFIAAKTKLLSANSSAPVATQPKANIGAVPRNLGQTYWASRWGGGSLFFPDAICLKRDGMVYRKGRLFGSTEENINYRAVASVRVSHGIIFSRMCIETSGGSQPIYMHGLWSADAKEIQNAIRQMQQKA